MGECRRHDFVDDVAAVSRATRAGTCYFLGSMTESIDVTRCAEGDVVDHRYRLIQLLGRGGMGEVWQAQHATLDRPVALKLLRIHTSELRAQLLHEARVLASLRHPAIVGVHDAGVTAEGVAYIAMDLLVGQSLSTQIYRQRLEAHAAVALFIELLGGLEAAHTAGVIHRDIKPDNVLLVARPLGVAPILIDFGIAQGTATGGQRSPTVAGTPEYMAPEQLRGMPCDERTDVWASCISLYETITGRVPFTGADLATTARSVITSPLAYPTDVPGLDGKLWSILTCGLRKDAADRTASACELRTSLTSWLARDTLPNLPMSNSDAPVRRLPQQSPFETLIRKKLTKV